MARTVSELRLEIITRERWFLPALKSASLAIIWVASWLLPASKLGVVVDYLATATALWGYRVEVR